MISERAVGSLQEIVQFIYTEAYCVYKGFYIVYWRYIRNRWNQRCGRRVTIILADRADLNIYFHSRRSEFSKTGIRLGQGWPYILRNLQHQR